MRGEAQIRAAARDDQVTAERNGLKRDWRREKLGVLLDKFEEEIKELKRAIDEEDTEGIRFEGSDVRWCVTMIQDHHGVLELETGTRLERRIGQLEEALDQALRQWRLYANSERFTEDECAIETGCDAEAEMYRAGLAALSSATSEAPVEKEDTGE